MNQDLGGVEKVLSEFFNNREVSGIRLKNPEIILIEESKASWRNLWNVKTRYEVRTLEETDSFSSFSLYSNKKHAEIIVKQKRNKLVVDVMSNYKTPQNTYPLPLTLEDSFEIPYKNI